MLKLKLFPPLSSAVLYSDHHVGINNSHREAVAEKILILTFYQSKPIFSSSSNLLFSSSLTYLWQNSEKAGGLLCLRTLADHLKEYSCMIKTS